MKIKNLQHGYDFITGQIKKCNDDSVDAHNELDKFSGAFAMLEQVSNRYAHARASAFVWKLWKGDFDTSPDAATFVHDIKLGILNAMERIVDSKKPNGSQFNNDKLIVETGKKLYEAMTGERFRMYKLFLK